MFGTERISDQLDSPAMYRRQLFITQSPVLANRVAKVYQNLVRTLESTEKMTTEQLVRAGKNNSKEDSGRKELNLVDIEDATAGLVGLPAKFTELQPSHFPLFLSSDSLLRLLEADLSISYDEPPRPIKRTRAQSANGVSPLDPFERIDTRSRTDCRWQHFVTLDVFVQWWKSFDQRETKKLDVRACWSEIQGVLKGSELAVGTEHGFIDEATYLGLSERKNPAFVGERERVYRIFRAYCLRKGEAGMTDPADRCVHLQ